MFNRKTNTEEPISYGDYYHDIKKCKLQFKDNPLLRSSGRNNRKIYLLPETCLISDMCVLDPVFADTLAIQKQKRLYRDSVPLVLMLGRRESLTFPNYC